MDLTDKLMTLLTVVVNPADQEAHNAEIAKVKDQITWAKADLAVEDIRGCFGCTSLPDYAGSECVE